jgi:folate-binding protein YgfZ
VQGPSDRAIAAALLTVKGKLVSELVVVPAPAGAGPGVDLLVPDDQAPTVATLLDRHIIMDEVEVREAGIQVAALVWNDDDAVSSDASVRVFSTRHPAPGRLVLGPAEAVMAMLGDHQAVDPAAFDLYRITTASPAWGHELQPGFFPPEVGYVYAVDYDKGCYMGQEPLARIHARGQVNRLMVRIEADRMPAGTVDLTHPDRREAGRWTTAAKHGEKVLGLAIVRRMLAVEGTGLASCGEDPIGVRVVSGPLGGDPGLGGGRTTKTVPLGRRS